MKIMLPKEHNLKMTQVLNSFLENIFPKYKNREKLYIYKVQYVCFLSERQKQNCLKKVGYVEFNFFHRKQNISSKSSQRNLKISLF